MKRNNTYLLRYNKGIMNTASNYCLIFEKINIFNSILIMMNNISYINKYISKMTEDKLICMKRIIII